MASQKTDKHSFTEPIIDEFFAAGVRSSLWVDGLAKPHYGLLSNLLSEPVSKNATARDGSYAAAADMWVAEELRRAGFDADKVWPRRHQPRVLPPDIAESLLATDAEKGDREAESLLFRVGRSDAKIWGSAYAKQTDVGVASSWASGPELLVSIKTQSSSFGKNVNNRIEESYGDAKNLKARFPMACVGYIMFLRDTVLASEPSAYERYIRAIRRFVDEQYSYDACALVLVHWDDNEGVSATEEMQGRVPDDLRIERFFETATDYVLGHALGSAHSTVRTLRSGALLEGRAEISYQTDQTE